MLAFGCHISSTLAHTSFPTLLSTFVAYLADIDQHMFSHLLVSASTTTSTYMWGPASIHISVYAYPTPITTSQQEHRNTGHRNMPKMARLLNECESPSYAYAYCLREVLEWRNVLHSYVGKTILYLNLERHRARGQGARSQAFREWG
jgi:hypothetical protein